jgi:putative transcriptional regulator
VLISQLDISRLVHEIRNRTGLTQEQFAARLGVTFPTINRWENGRAKPSPLAIKQIEALLRDLGEKGRDLLEPHSGVEGAKWHHHTEHLWFSWWMMTWSRVRRIEGILTHVGYDVMCAPDAAGALRGIRERHPDLVLLDVNLPDGSGLEVCQQIQREPGAMQTPVLFISADGEVASKIKGFVAGGVDYIPKPFSGQEVVARVWDTPAA